MTAFATWRMRRAAAAGNRQHKAFDMTAFSTLSLVSKQEWQDTVRAAVLKAERALLYVISFDFKVRI